MLKAVFCTRSYSAEYDNPFYGSGIYALYYYGSLPFYAPISKSSTPIYVGKANPPKGAKSESDFFTGKLDRLILSGANVLFEQGQIFVEVGAE